MPNDQKQFNGESQCLPLGCRLSTKQADQHWLALDREDWKILLGLLTKSLPSFAPEIQAPLRVGMTVQGFTLPAASASPALEGLAEFARLAIEWYDRTGYIPRPEGQGVGE